MGLPVSFSANAGISHNVSNTLRLVNMPDGSVNTSDYYMNYSQLSFDLGASLGRRWTPNFAIVTVSGGVNSYISHNFYDDSI